MKKNNLIADIGGTSSRWIWLEDGILKEHKLSGYNPFQSNWEQFEIIVAEVSQKSNINFEHIDIYGAGFVGVNQIENATEIVRKHITFNSIQIQSDIMLVVNATPASDQKVVIILGTGCNSIHASNGIYESFVPPLGYAMGDEGSGAYFGKALIRAYYYGRLDSKISKELEVFHNMDRAYLLQKVYKGEAPSAFLASFFPFIKRFKDHHQIKSLIQSGIKDHFESIVKSYPKEAPYHYSGSVAWELRDYLREIFAENGLYLGEIIQEPLQELLKYKGNND